MKRFLPFIIIIILAGLVPGINAQAQGSLPGLRVQGRFLYTPCGDKVILRGVNKMIIFTDDTALRRQTYAEIRKTRANSVRIVWLAEPSNENDAGPAGLDRNIQYCIDNAMIPMVELHDATGEWSSLSVVVNYWLRPDVISVIKKHERYLLINIGNEVGNDLVTADMFKSGYESAVSLIRAAGIHVPLVIDAPDWGKNLAVLRQAGQYLIDKDPDHNLIFSVHTYWDIAEGANEAFITSEFQQAVDISLPFIVGEFTYKFNRDAGCIYETDYKAIIQRAEEMQIGWYAWEWGPGNDFYEPSCNVMNMTTDSYYNTLKEGWALDVARDNPYSIARTSQSTKYIENGGVCDTVQSVSSREITDVSIAITPNPAGEITMITLDLPQSEFISLKIYNTLGQEIATLADGMTAPGLNQYAFNVTGKPQGLYYCVFRYSQSARTAMFTVAR